MMVYVILVLYLAITFGGSLINRDDERTPENYFLANRGIKTIGLFFTILATNFSAFYFLGFAGEGYMIGYAHYIIMALGTGLVGPAFFLIGTRIWRLGKEKGYITPAELIYGETGHRGLAILFSAVMVVFTLPYLSLQIIGGGYILEALTGGTITYGLAIVLLTIFTIAYVILGGMESVARTDLKQGLIVILFMVLAVCLIGHDLGGIISANERAAQIVPEAFSWQGIDAHYSTKKWISFMAFWFFCVPMFPQLFMRFYVAQDERTLQKSTILYAFIPLIISILPVTIGVWGHITFPELSGQQADQILPMMLQEHAGEVLSAIVMTGAIAAFMSTLDSQLLAISTMVTRDYILPYRPMELAQQVKLGRLLVAIFAVIGLAIAVHPNQSIFDMGKMAFSGLAVLFPITLYTVHYRWRAPICGVIAIVISLAILVSFHYGWLPKHVACGWEPFMLMILCSFVISGLGVRKGAS